MDTDIDDRIRRVEAAESRIKWRYGVMIAVAITMYFGVFSAAFQYHWPSAVWPSIGFFAALWQVLRFRDIRVEKRVLQQVKQNVANECKS